MNSGSKNIDDRSRRRLRGVHPVLIELFEQLAQDPETPAFMITEGVRTLTRQKELVAAKASRTLKSKHLTGRAVDIAVLHPGKLTPIWTFPDYANFAKHVKRKALDMRLQIVWGGDWLRFRDGVHFELHPDVPADPQAPDPDNEPRKTVLGFPVSKPVA